MALLKHADEIAPRRHQGPLLDDGGGDARVPPPRPGRAPGSTPRRRPRPTRRPRSPSRTTRCSRRTPASPPCPPPRRWGRCRRSRGASKGLRSWPTSPIPRGRRWRPPAREIRAARRLRRARSTWAAAKARPFHPAEPGGTGLPLPSATGTGPMPPPRPGTGAHSYLHQGTRIDLNDQARGHRHADRRHRQGPSSPSSALAGDTNQLRADYERLRLPRTSSPRRDRRRARHLQSCST